MIEAAQHVRVKSKQATTGKKLAGASRDVVKLFLRESSCRAFSLQDAGHFALGKSK